MVLDVVGPGPVWHQFLFKSDPSRHSMGPIRLLDVVVGPLWQQFIFMEGVRLDPTGAAAPSSWMLLRVMLGYIIFPFFVRKSLDVFVVSPVQADGC